MRKLITMVFVVFVLVTQPAIGLATKSQDSQEAQEAMEDLGEAIEDLANVAQSAVSDLQGIGAATTEGLSGLIEGYNDAWAATVSSISMPSFNFTDEMLYSLPNYINPALGKQFPSYQVKFQNSLYAFCMAAQEISKVVKTKSRVTSGKKTLGNVPITKLQRMLSHFMRMAQKTQGILARMEGLQQWPLLPGEEQALQEVWEAKGKSFDDDKKLIKKNYKTQRQAQYALANVTMMMMMVKELQKRTAATATKGKSKVLKKRSGKRTASRKRRGVAVVGNKFEAFINKLEDLKAKFVSLSKKCALSGSAELAFDKTYSCACAFLEAAESYRALASSTTGKNLTFLRGQRSYLKFAVGALDHCARRYMSDESIQSPGKATIMAKIGQVKRILK